MNSPRLIYSLFAVSCASLLGFGYFLEYVKGIEPCPLCILQRLAYFTVVVCGIIGAAHGPRAWGRRVYSGLICLAGLAGAGVAIRQVWLQHLPPDQVPACGPGLEFMINTFPLSDAIKMIFHGSGECAQIQWTFLTLSIAEWSLICFSLIIIGSVVHLFKKGN